MAQFLGNKIFSRKSGLLVVVFTGRSAISIALVRLTIFGALVLVIKPWILLFLLTTCIFQVRITLLLTEHSIITLSNCIEVSSEDAPCIFTQY